MDGYNALRAYPDGSRLVGAGADGNYNAVTLYKLDGSVEVQVPADGQRYRLGLRAVNFAGLASIPPTMPLLPAGLIGASYSRGRRRSVNLGAGACVEESRCK